MFFRSISDKQDVNNDVRKLIESVTKGHDCQKKCWDFGFFLYQICSYALFYMQKTIPELLAVVRALSDQRFLSYERFRKKVTFQKREFTFLFVDLGLQTPLTD